MSKPVIKKGQEWERAGGAWGRLMVRIRIATDPDGCANPSVEVETLLGEVRSMLLDSSIMQRWGRRRRLMCSALSNTPKGYRLVKEEAP